jgi:hypothetical protein
VLRCFVNQALGKSEKYFTRSWWSHYQLEA